MKQLHLKLTFVVLVVVFGHRSVFPVMFDADSLEKWWKSALVFKVYGKSPGQKLVCSSCMFMKFYVSQQTFLDQTTPSINSLNLLVKKYK
jgi:hypothetical protein